MKIFILLAVIAVYYIALCEVPCTAPDPNLKLEDLPPGYTLDGASFDAESDKEMLHCYYTEEQQGQNPVFWVSGKTGIRGFVSWYYTFSCDEDSISWNVLYQYTLKSEDKIGCAKMNRSTICSIRHVIDEEVISVEIGMNTNTMCNSGLQLKAYGPEGKYFTGKSVRCNDKQEAYIDDYLLGATYHAKEFNITCEEPEKSTAQPEC